MPPIRQSNACLALVIASCLQSTAAAAQAAQIRGTPVPRDRAVAALVAQALFSTLASSVAAAAFDSAMPAVDVSFPDAEAPDAWRELRMHLDRVLRAHRLDSTDRRVLYIAIGDALVEGDSIDVALSLSHQRRCRTGWGGTLERYSIRSARQYDGRWGPPILRWRGESLGGCMDPPDDSAASLSNEALLQSAHFGMRAARAISF